MTAGAEQSDQRFSLRDLARIEAGGGGGLAGRARPQQAAHAAGSGFDLGPERAGDLAADGSELAAPGRIDREIELAAHSPYGVVDAFE
jgi:hypothetical protein